MSWPFYTTISTNPFSFFLQPYSVCDWNTQGVAGNLIGITGCINGSIVSEIRLGTNFVISHGSLVFTLASYACLLIWCHRRACRCYCHHPIRNCSFGRSGGFECHFLPCGFNFLQYLSIVPFRNASVGMHQQLPVSTEWASPEWNRFSYKADNAGLFRKCLNRNNTNWNRIAHKHPNVVTCRQQVERTDPNGDWTDFDVDNVGFVFQRSDWGNADLDSIFGKFQKFDWAEIKLELSERSHHAWDWNAYQIDLLVFT